MLLISCTESVTWEVQYNMLLRERGLKLEMTLRTARKCEFVQTSLHIVRLVQIREEVKTNFGAEGGNSDLHMSLFSPP